MNPTNKHLGLVQLLYYGQGLFFCTPTHIPIDNKMKLRNSDILMISDNLRIVSMSVVINVIVSVATLIIFKRRHPGQ